MTFANKPASKTGKPQNFFPFMETTSCAAEEHQRPLLESPQEKKKETFFKKCLLAWDKSESSLHISLLSIENDEFQGHK